LEQLVYKSNRKLQYDVKKLSITWDGYHLSWII
jgi:hypothetical protein